MIKNFRHVSSIVKSLISTRVVDDTRYITMFGNSMWKISKESMIVVHNEKYNSLYMFHVCGVKHSVINVTKQTSVNHDYTITNTKTMNLAQVEVSASGSAKWTIQYGLPASLSTLATIWTSPSRQKATFKLPEDLRKQVTSTGTEIIRIVKYNDDNNDMDMYSTIIGEETT